MGAFQSVERGDCERRFEQIIGNTHLTGGALSGRAPKPGESHPAFAAQELLQRPEGLGTQTDRLQHAMNGGMHQVIIVDDEYCGNVGGLHSRTSALVGKER